MPVQFNGKVRFTIEISKDATKEEANAKACENEAYETYTEGKKIVKEIFVPGKIYNIVVK